MVRLICMLVGVAGSVFSVVINENEKIVSELKDAIKEKNEKTIECDAHELKLFLAKKDGAWLESNTDDVEKLKEGKKTAVIETLTHKDKELQGEDDLQEILMGMPPPVAKQVHVLVVVPMQQQPQTELWLVSGSIVNAFNTKGVRCRLYRLAGSYLGYYDPELRSSDNDKALWYEGTTLRVHVLFKEERDALLFENALQDERITVTSPLNRQVIVTNVTRVSEKSSSLRRIFAQHYDPQETESPQYTLSSFSTNTSIVDIMTEEFKYQRIESDTWFGPLGKAQSCHLMSRAHCRKYESYHKYDNDKNNRLALSSEMHGWYDALTVATPVMNIHVESVSQRPVMGNRFEVKLVIKALDAGYGQLISMRLKEGAVVSPDRLEMRTSVHVENPTVFRECMAWKHKQIAKDWEDYFSMAPAAD